MKIRKIALGAVLGMVSIIAEPVLAVTLNGEYSINVTTTQLVLTPIPFNMM